jgi:DNA-binding NtrC family response regulator
VREREIDIRVVAATNRDLEQEVQAGRFRQDLYFRLSAATVVLPPLRNRPREVAILARTFLEEACARMKREPMSISAAAMRGLSRHGWPGNVRELKNVIERAVILAPGIEIGLDLLPPRLLSTPRLASLGGVTVSGDGGLTLEFRPGTDTLDGLERQLLEAALKMADGRKSRAAELLGISRFALLRRVEKYGLG